MECLRRLQACCSSNSNVLNGFHREYPYPHELDEEEYDEEQARMANAIEDLSFTDESNGLMLDDVSLLPPGAHRRTKSSSSDPDPGMESSQSNGMAMVMDTKAQPVRDGESDEDSSENQAKEDVDSVASDAEDDGKFVPAKKTSSAKDSKVRGKRSALETTLILGSPKRMDAEALDNHDYEDVASWKKASIISADVFNDDEEYNVTEGTTKLLDKGNECEMTPSQS